MTAKFRVGTWIGSWNTMTTVKKKKKDWWIRTVVILIAL